MKDLFWAVATLVGATASIGLVHKFIPRGSRYFELLDLFPFWWNVFRHPVQPMQEKRYRYGDHFRQYVLFFQAAESHPTPKGTIIYFHGGGWRFGKPEQFRANAQLLVHQGYSVIMPSYRRIPVYNYWHIRHDLTSILRLSKTILQEHNLKDKKLILGGLSAGGNLAALMYYNEAELEKAGFSKSDFSGLFFFGAPLDLREMRPSVVLRAFAGKADSEQFKQANPITYITEMERTPVLCIHGNCDGLVEYGCSASFHSLMETLHPGLVEFHTLPDATHLDAARWSYKDEQVRRLLLNWLKKLEIR